MLNLWNAERPNSPQKPTSRRMPRPPAEPAGSARDGRRHAACRSLRQNPSFLAASGAPPVRSRVGAACSLTSDPLARPTTSRPPEKIARFSFSRSNTARSDCVSRTGWWSESLRGATPRIVLSSNRSSREASREPTPTTVCQPSFR